MRSKKRHTKPSRFSIHPLSNTAILIITVLLLLFSILGIYQAQQRQNQRSSAQTLTNCTVSDTDTTLDTEEQKLFTQINDYRHTVEAPPLQLSTTLSRSAAWLSNDMATNNNYSHTDTLGRDTSQRIHDCGYAATGTFGENIYNAGTTTDDVLASWMGSPEHNSIMIDPLFKVGGLARNGSYWTLVVAESDTNSPSVSQTPSSPSTVPSPGCIGSCPTPTNTPTPTVTNTPVPTTSNAPASTSPSPATTISPGITEPPSGNNPNGNQSNILQLLLSIIMAFLNFILQLFKF